MENMKEIRELITSIECRAIADDENEYIELSGQAIVYDRFADTGWGFQEQVKAGAAREAIKNNVYMLFSHDKDRPMGSTDSKTLSLEEKRDGVYFTAKIPKTSDAEDLRKLVNAGVITGMSFGMIMEDADQQWEIKNGQESRTITKISKLIEISPVARPVWADTKIGTRENREYYAELISKVIGSPAIQRSSLDFAKAQAEYNENKINRSKKWKI